MARLRMGYLLRRGANLADLIDKAAARLNLGLGSAATKNDDRYTHRANNLNDVSSAAGARDNLGLGSAATKNDTRYAHRGNNLSDLASKAAARDNLYLGTAAVKDATASRFSSSTDHVLRVDGMNDHRTSGDHDGRYVRRDIDQSIDGTLKLNASLYLESAGNRHVWFRNESGANMALFYHRESDGKLIFRVLNGAGSTQGELRIDGSGNITADSTSRFQGDGSGLHSLSSAEVGEATATLPYADVGAYMLLRTDPLANKVPGDTAYGSNLKAVNVAGGADGWGYYQSGTWECVGRTAAGNGEESTTLWKRIQ